MKRRSFDIDFVTLALMVGLMLLGWLTIYAVSAASGEVGLFDFSYNHGRQFIWIIASLVVGLIILALDNRFLEAISYLAYGLAMALLILVLFVGREINGATSWLIIGSVQIQPSEFAKVATAMALARYMSQLNFSLKNQQQAMIAFGIILLPALIVILQNDTGSALVFGSFLIVFFREGLTPIVPLLLLGIVFVAVLTLWLANPWIVTFVIFSLGVISFLVMFERRAITGLIIAHLAIVIFLGGVSFSTEYILSNLQEHQQNRIMVLFDTEIDPQGVGYNVRQSKIAIGSGGLWGKGFLKGNYTKYEFVPKQVTDFIYCTVGEEQGWIGTSTIVILFFLLLLRIRFISERAKTRYARIYGYGVVSIFFFHIAINIGMTIGLVPVIGIPLPFFSYGGSSLLAFTILIAVLINHYSYRATILGAKN